MDTLGAEEVDAEQARSELKGLVRRHWPVPNWPDLFTQSRTLWNEHELWAVYWAFMILIPAMSQQALPGGQAPPGQAAMMVFEPNEEILASMGDRPRALATFEAVSELTMAGSVGDSSTRSRLQQVSREFQGSGLYVLVVLLITSIGAVDEVMPGAGDISLRSLFDQLDAVQPPTGDTG